MASTLEKRLTAFWIQSPLRHAPIGIGVTAWSLEDALGIMISLGYGPHLPDNYSQLQVREGVTVAELD